MNVDALHQINPETLGVGGVVVGVVVLLILWKLVKMALKLALFVAICVALAAGVGGDLKYGKVGLPIPDAPHR